ncbi:MAG: hypothetical protein ABFD94_18920 [Armatimonadia bacterium]
MPESHTVDLPRDIPAAYAVLLALKDEDVEVSKAARGMLARYAIEHGLTFTVSKQTPIA